MDGLAARARWSPIGETETLPGHRILHGLPLRLRAVRAGDPVSPRPLPATPRRVRCHPADYCSSLLLLPVCFASTGNLNLGSIPLLLAKASVRAARRRGEPRDPQSCGADN